MNLTVGVDIKAACGKTISGVGLHIIRLLESIDRIAPAGWQFPLFFECSNKQMARRAHDRFPVSKRMPIVPVPFPKTKYATIRRLLQKHWYARFVNRHGCQVFHGPAHMVSSHYRIPTVVTIHDMAFFYHDLYPPTFANALKQAVLNSLSSAAVVIALSEATKNDVADISDRKKDVHVVYGAGNFSSPPTNVSATDEHRVLQELGIQDKYILYVGDFGPRKNLPFLIESFARFRNSSVLTHPVSPDSASDNPVDPRTVQLVMAGNSVEAKPALQKIAGQHGIENTALIFPGRVSDQTLSTLYRHAAVFALSSKAEGFGMIILEAMSSGVPVVACDITTIREVAGDAAVLVPLGDTEAFAHSLRKVLTQPDWRASLITRGHQRVKKFSWENNARETLELYKLASQTAGRANS